MSFFVSRRRANMGLLRFIGTTPFPPERMRSERGMEGEIRGVH